ncbi:hypothetical protein RCG24_17315 [Neobacillus sp. OS1-32]|uniref:hypothetical protein n=1 Tax=Neobacillus sp. OS1-32 TaxID=3070682 RepID=UPI0027E0F8C1|nr:hypothetical protein [Neobacillus sp. OS1-32]WML29659.1 hypothetical protein RCG24_17315 [Neobacillus sp. OS1-32]
MSLKGKYFKLLAAIFICILSVSSFCNIPVAAKSSSKVYPAYDFNGDAGKFPKKLPNNPLSMVADRLNLPLPAIVIRSFRIIPGQLAGK